MVLLIMLALLLGVAETSDVEISCTGLDKMERDLVFNSSHGTMARIKQHRGALARWTGAQQSNNERECRIASLGTSLCALAKVVLSEQVRSQTLDPMVSTKTWVDFMTEHTGHLTSDTDCARYSQYRGLNWNPPVHSWPEAEFTQAVVKDMLHDNVGATFQPALCNLDYGPQDVKVERNPSVAPCAFRGTRSQPTNHLWTLQLATGIRPADFSTILEFGGGTGDLASVFRDMQFEGLHVIYDFPQMNLHHRYWQRYSGIPSYLLGHDVPAHIAQTHARGLHGTVLLTNGVEHKGTLLTDMLPGLHLESTSNHSLVFATWSLSEAGTLTREQFRPIIKQFSHVLLAYTDSGHAAGFGSDDFFSSLAKDLLTTHSICAWRMAHYARDTYIIAVRRGHGEAGCPAAAGCSEARLNSNIPHTCNSQPVGLPKTKDRFIKGRPYPFPQPP